MKNCIIDFETYYDKDVSVVTLGTPNYVKQADAYIVGLTVEGEAHCGTLAEMGPVCEQIAKDPQIRPVAANSNFDQAWWEKYYPPFKNDFHCLLDHSAYHQMPRNLAGLAGALLGHKVDKTTRDEMKGVRYEDLPADEQEAVQKYCLNDCLVEEECLQKLAPMSSFEEEVAAHTRLINRRGIRIDTDLVSTDKTKLEAMRFEAFKSIPWHADYPPLSYPALVRYCGTRNIAVPKSLAKTDEECADMISENEELAKIIGDMRRFRRANTMIKKAEMLLGRVTEEGVLAMDLLYCGAPHTRRWSSKGFNVQNLDKEPLVTGRVCHDLNNPSEYTDETVWTRRWIVPRPGYTFLILDFAQIEPRCLNWLCGNDEMMEALRNGFSYYEAYVRASKQEKRVGWSGTPGALKKEVGVARYTKIKNESLGCGYGMGASKYTTYAKVAEDEAKEIVDGFRKSNLKVVAFWRKLDNLIITAARDKSKCLAMELPSGDLLRHFNVRSSGRGYESFTVKGDFSHNSRQPRLWGGTLTENVTQRMARDVLASAIVRLEKAGLRVAFHCHDEVILEVPVSSKDEARKEAEQILRTPPEWASDLPLNVEGDFADSYTK
jgi:DNA polymerase